jgi:NADH-quinone oxidoreductase subunit C
VSDAKAASDTAAPTGVRGGDTPGEEEEAAPPPPPERYGAPLTESRGQACVHVARGELADFVLRLRDDEGFTVCIDVTAVDYLAFQGDRGLPAGIAAERFELVVNLLSHTKVERLRVRVQVPADDPVAPSLFDVHPGTEAMEREVFDLFGIRFDGHPDLSRILMPEDWIGHPLRKDYAIGRIPVQFKGIENTR